MIQSIVHFGAKVARVPEISMAGFAVPGEETDEGHQVWRSAMPIIGLPHHIVVNAGGKRFGNEGFYRSFYYQTDVIDGVNQTHPNFPCWIVIDSQAREKYAFVSIMPGQDWPEGLGVVADTIEELAAKAGIDPQGLAETVGRFNEEMISAGVLVAAEGLDDAEQGVVIDFSAQPPVVTDGPYGETKELFGGFWILDVASKEEAVEWAKRAPMTGPGMKTEIRRVASIDEFPQDNPWIQKERAWREATGQL